MISLLLACFWISVVFIGALAAVILCFTILKRD